MAEAPKGGFNTGKMWTIGIFVIIIVMANVIGSLTGQLGSFLHMIRFNMGAVIFIAILVALFRATKGNS